MEHIQISKLVDHTNPRAILSETKKIFLESYPEKEFTRIENAFENILLLFNGKYKDYMACNTEYHDLTHTLDALLACARLMDGRNLSGEPFSVQLATELLLSTLLHDTGYIQKNDDINGTGAKYTASHVERSIEFVKFNMDDFGIEPSAVDSVGILIACTGLRNRWEDFTFYDSSQMIAGTILATADLLGQMSDRAYLEKLLFLYYEFREAGIEGYNTEFDILRKTLDFYELTQTRLETTLKGSYLYAAVHFAVRKEINYNLYMEAIEHHMNYLKRILSDQSTNFRQKLKRLDIESAEARYKSRC
ncbi:MAG TPA: hypothetical protein PK514_06985 [Spirochaetota bacterium]|nr:hypothetical protein [Spirochaetota bacterium]